MFWLFNFNNFVYFLCNDFHKSSKKIIKIIKNKFENGDWGSGSHLLLNKRENKRNKLQYKNSQNNIYHDYEENKKIYLNYRIFHLND